MKKRMQHICAWMSLLPVTHTDTMQHMCASANLTRALCTRCGAVDRLRHTTARYDGRSAFVFPSFHLARVHASVTSVHKYYNTL
eukprot:70563-Amphidinium_carterae.2